MSSEDRGSPSIHVLDLSSSHHPPRVPKRRRKTLSISLPSSKTASEGISSFRRRDYSRSSDEELPFDKDALEKFVDIFGHYLQNPSAPDLHYLEDVGYAKKVLGISVERGLGDAGDAWRLGGFNAAPATTALGNLPEEHPTTYDEARVALANAARFVQKWLVDVHKQYYSLRTMRRSREGTVTRRKTLLVPVERRLSNVPQLGNLASYKLPKDLRMVMRAMGIQYRPKFNPRIRRLKRGDARHRFVFAYYSVNPGPIVQRFLGHKDLVRGGRNWDAIYPNAVHNLGGDSVKNLLTWVLKHRPISERGFCTILIFANHAFVMYGYLKKTQLKLFLLDPHADTHVYSRLGKAGFKHIRDKLVEQGRARYPKLSVSIQTPNAQCASNVRSGSRLIPVQPPSEGSCAIASMALMLNVARLLKKMPNYLMRLRPKQHHHAFCKKAYNEVRIQDAVFVTQLVHN